SSTVTVLSYNEEKGRFAALETISTLPVDFEGTKSASALRLSSGFDLDIAKEELSNLTEVAHVQNATYFALDKTKQHLYTCAADE
ncbi:beta-propeller fold lactonase family protein, partial [Lactococcus petauri]|uniref:beta-propeller fold lactonase family protein n=1 Tax=Lactococcus petauri TaxID=1940789 RepID=UPI003D6F6EE7